MFATAESDLTRPICANATLTEFSIPVLVSPPFSETVTAESGVKYIASSFNGLYSV